MEFDFRLTNMVSVAGVFHISMHQCCKESHAAGRGSNLKARAVPTFAHASWSFEQDSNLALVHPVVLTESGAVWLPIWKIC